MSESETCSGDPGITREEANKKLIEAAGSGDHEGVSKVLDEGAEITYKGSDGHTGLHLGAYKGHDNVVKTFLEAGIDVNIRDGAETKWTALINAAYLDKISCLKILLEYGADPDLKGEKDGQTALMYAAERNYPDLAAELLVKGADPYILNSSGKSAIQLAKENNSQDAAKLLEVWGNQEALNLELMTAARQGRGRLVSRFIRAGADVQTRDESGETGLDKAVKRGHRAAAEAFLDHGITGYNREECLQQCDNNRERINKLNEEVISAATSGDNQGVEASLEEGAEITSTDKWGDNGLHLSAKEGHQSVVLTLLTRGLDPNIRGYKQSTGLMLAAVYGHLPCVQTLLDYGALTDLKDEFGDTALMEAAKSNYPDIVAEILGKGANDKIVNNAGKSALQLAEEDNCQDVVIIMEARENKDNLNKEMLAAAGEGKQRLVHALITAGADLETRDEKNNTALHISAQKGHESVVRLLLQHGIDVNIRGEDDRTPLITAAWDGHHRITRLLIKSGADLNLQDGGGVTALMLAAYYGHTRIGMELLQAGADRDLKDTDNWTALRWAEGKGDIELILKKDQIQDEDEERGARAVLEATEAGCPKIVSELLTRGAKWETENDMAETPFQIAARLPKTRKDEFEEYLKEVERKKEIKPKETVRDIREEAEKDSKDLAKVFLSFTTNTEVSNNLSNVHQISASVLQMSSPRASNSDVVISVGQE